MIYNELKNENIDSTLSLISKTLEGERTDKLRFTRTPLLNSIEDELGKLLLKENNKFEKLMELWKNGGRDEKLIVISAIGRISKTDYNGSKRFILNILNDINDWEICDQIALRIIVNLAIQNQKDIFSLMEEWKQSDNKWLRRLAVATIPPYIRAKKHESKICLNFLDNLMKEQDKDVKKAIGWALREITKKDPESVFKFLWKWTKTSNKNTNWIIKEGMKKLPQDKQKELMVLISG